MCSLTSDAMAKRPGSSSPLLEANDDFVVEVADGGESTRSESIRSRTGMKRNHFRQRGISHDAVRPSHAFSITFSSEAQVQFRQRLCREGEVVQTDRHPMPVPTQTDAWAVSTRTRCRMVCMKLSRML